MVNMLQHGTLMSKLLVPMVAPVPVEPKLKLSWLQAFEASTYTARKIRKKLWYSLNMINYK